MTGPAVTVSVRAVLSFKDALGAVGRVSVPRARLGLTGPEAAQAMAEMIGSGALALRGIGRPAAAADKWLVRTERERIV